MKRPGFLNGIDAMIPKYSNLGMLPPSLGPNIPGIPTMSPFIFPHPMANPRAIHRRKCGSCRLK